MADKGDTVPTNQEKKEEAESKEPSKKALKKLEKEKKKAELKEAAKKQREANAPSTKEEEKCDNFGVLPLIQSTTRPRRTFTAVKDLNESKADQSVLIRGRLQTSRASGNLCFIVLREKYYTVQGVLSKGKEVPKSMLTFVSGIAKESIVDVEGKVVLTKEKITSTTQQTVEIFIQKVFVVSAAEPSLPLQIEDASRPKSVFKAQSAEIARIEAQIQEVTSKISGKEDAPENKEIVDQLKELQKKRSEAQKYVKVRRETRLDNRVLDLRTPTNQAIFKMQHAVCQLFREYLSANDFTEIHSPKMLPAASEGGAEFFKVKYFEKETFLAQSPQLYKQMTIAGDMDRVFEIGPVFRAEKSFTHRHLTEFVGLDLEMAFKEHYHEVLDVLDGLFTSLFDGLKTRYAKELEIIGQQFPFEPLQYSVPSLRLKYPEIVAMLREAGEEMGDLEDLSTAKERVLGKLVKAKYGVDFFILDRFPAQVRPFYSMPSADDTNYANAYDFFLRGEEIMSGAQRIHDVPLLTKRCEELGVSVESIRDYVNAFKYGAAPHAGGGIGLERVVMLYLGLKNIRQTSMFPRDPNRTTP